MHLGVMAYAAGELENSKKYFEDSVAACPNSWSLRNLAMIYRNHLDDPQTAADLMEQAVALKGDNRSLWMDMATTLLKAERYERLVTLYETLPECYSAEGRLKLYTAQALMALKRYKEATKLLNYDIAIPDIKEGENSISDLWFKLYGAILKEETGVEDEKQLMELVEERYPLKHLDFRMH
jgi:tetratricopeptide (TPR) repeat protein